MVPEALPNEELRRCKVHILQHPIQIYEKLLGRVDSEAGNVKVDLSPWIRSKMDRQLAIFDGSYSAAPLIDSCLVDQIVTKADDIPKSPSSRFP